MPITAPAFELQKNFRCYQDLALTGETVRVTMYGRETVYIVSAKTFHELKRGQRQAVGTADIIKAEVALIEAAEHRSSLDDERS